MSQWFVYILRCSDKTLYTGITTDTDRRVKEHNGEIPTKGAKCTRARRPVRLVYQEECTNRSSSSKREWEIKQLSRKEKDMLIRNARQ